MEYDMNNNNHQSKWKISYKNRENYISEISEIAYKNIEKSGVSILNDILFIIVKYVLENYYKIYPRCLGNEQFKMNCSVIVTVIASILSSSILFKIVDSKYYYEFAIWERKYKGRTKDIIMTYFESKTMNNTLMYLDTIQYVNVIYKTIKDLMDHDNVKNEFFQGVDILEQSENKIKIDFRKLSSKEKNVLRLEILMFFKRNRNLTMQEIADFFKVEVRNVSFIINGYLKNPSVDFRTYEDKKRGPEQKFFNRIPAKVFAELLETIVYKLPKDFDIDFSSWTGYAIVQYLKLVHNIDVTRKYVYYILNKFEINSKFGKRSNPKRDIDELNDFIRHKYREICEQAKRNGEVVAFGDESSSVKGHHDRGFAPKGIRALVMHNTATSHTGDTFFCIISPEGLYKMILVLETFNATAFITCLEALHKEYPDKKFVLILDNSRVHHAKMVKKWIERLEKNHNKFFRFEWLPAYCPEINPVEYVNNDFKAYLRNKASLTKEDVRKVAKNYISEYHRGDEDAVKQRIINFFKAQDCLFTYSIYMDVFYNFNNNIKDKVA